MSNNWMDQFEAVMGAEVNNTQEEMEPVPSSEPPEESNSDDVYSHPDLSNLTTQKVPHKDLVLAGVADRCAHCGLQLSDSISIQRSLGPVCSRKGYSEDPVDGDEVQAMIDLAEFPELVEFLTKHYKPLGIRGLVNGLVRVASLNRPHGRGRAKGNATVHSACCDAVESLGHRKLAKLLRETLIIMKVDDSELYPGCFRVWVVRREWKKEWSWDLRRETSDSFFCKKEKGIIIPIKDQDGRLVRANYKDSEGRPRSNKWVLWNNMLKHYGGMVARVNGDTIKIVEKR